MEHHQCQNLLAIRGSSINGARAYYQTSGLSGVAVPVLVGIRRMRERLNLVSCRRGTPVHLTQTCQLALEHALCLSKGVYCLTSSFRTDKIDKRT